MRRRQLYGWDDQGLPVLRSDIDQATINTLVPLIPLTTTTLPKIIEKINEIVDRQNILLSALKDPQI